MARVMRGIVDGFHMGKTDKTDDEQAKHDRRQRLGKTGRFGRRGGIGRILVDGHGDPSPARPRAFGRGRAAEAAKPHAIHFTTGIRD